MNKQCCSCVFWDGDASSYIAPCMFNNSYHRRTQYDDNCNEFIARKEDTKIEQRDHSNERGIYYVNNVKLHIKQSGFLSDDLEITDKQLKALQDVGIRGAREGNELKNKLIGYADCGIFSSIYTW